MIKNVEKIANSIYEGKKSYFVNIGFNTVDIISYDTKVGKVDYNNKTIYLTNKKYSVTTTRHLNKLAYLMSKKGFKIVWQDNI